MAADKNYSHEAVIIRLRLSDDEFGDWEERQAAYRIEDLLLEAFEGAGVGEYDGHDFGGGFATLYAYGPSADRIATVVLASLTGVAHRPGSVLIKRFGPPGSREETVPLA
jgi:hypothetical protein